MLDMTRIVDNNGRLDLHADLVQVQGRVKISNFETVVFHAACLITHPAFIVTLQFYRPGSGLLAFNTGCKVLGIELVIVLIQNRFDIGFMIVQSHRILQTRIFAVPVQSKLQDLDHFRSVSVQLSGRKLF